VETQFVRAVFDLDCSWEGLPPVYRVYVRDELFAEREWRWTDCYLEETLQIQAETGVYAVRIEPLVPNLAHFRAHNHRIEHGLARWNDHQMLEIFSPGPDHIKFLYFFIDLSREEEILTRGTKPIDQIYLYPDTLGRFILLADDVELAERYFQQTAAVNENTDLLMIALDVQKLDQNRLCLDQRSKFYDATKFWQYHGYVRPVMVASRKKCQISSVNLSAENVAITAIKHDQSLDFSPSMTYTAPT
jgi:hypothetical protein